MFKVRKSRESKEATYHVMVCANCGFVFKIEGKLPDSPPRCPRCHKACVPVATDLYEPWEVAEDAWEHWLKKEKPRR